MIQACAFHDQSYGFAPDFVVLITIPGGYELNSKLCVSGCTITVYK